MITGDRPLPARGRTHDHERMADAVTWERFVAACQADPELGPYMSTVLGLAAAVLGDPGKNLQVLGRIAGHLANAKEFP